MSSQLQNTAAWLPAKQARPFQIGPADIPTLKPGEVLIKVHAVAINPADAGIQNLGLLWEKYPVIIGCDLAGEVVDVGDEVDSSRNIRKGDRVLACVEKGAFQQYCAAAVELVAKIPEHVSYTQASVLPAGLSTAVVSLFHEEGMRLELPSLEPKSNGQVIVVWGGSSSVGSCGIQLLVAAGYGVFATAGARNATYCEELGATRVFDYTKDGIEEEIVEAVQGSGKKFGGIFSAIMTLDVLNMVVRLADKLGHDEQSRTVGTVVPPDMPGFPLPELPSGVTLAFCRGPTAFVQESELAAMLGWSKRPASHIGRAVFEEWLTPALEAGLLKCKPEAQVVGRGLEKVQDACDMMSNGVSATKVVVVLEGK
ncbi:hypothetical protein CBER1_05003 [Cercospora berteroae]|uniref:Enoyl reductase (ER) domain-containing protein n=1 Tax=Cercospora berteroae TaxID=357750 RepID=A0A2S6BQU4_9PEZI|nr:hypothetical protein CBER1_05003 [Cercospora berteroae]